MKASRGHLLRIICLALIAWSLCEAPAFIPGLYADDAPALLQLSAISTDKEIFNPSRGEQVRIRFRLSQPAKVSLNIFDCNQELVAVLSPGKTLDPGVHTLKWDGRDQHKQVVPDEAYWLTLEASQGSRQVIYDPRAVSGGISHEIERVNILPDPLRLEYLLPETGRVSLRVGLVNGPLLAIPVDWEPRVKGRHREPWDGMDQEKLIPVLQQPNYQIRATYYTLPPNTLITKGNNHPVSRHGKPDPGAAGTPQSPAALKPSGSLLTSPLFLKQIIFAKAPPLQVDFPGAVRDDNRTLLLPRNFKVRADFSEAWREYLHPLIYEIYFFLDGKFLLEFPNIHLPYEADLNLKDHQPGLHVLTVNLIDIGGQVGIKSTQVRILD